ncbi:MAG TPA: hypothetical protein VGI12_10135 [Vicinamibacterales bacterium]
MSEVGEPQFEGRGSHDRFDRAIDRAVREMLDVEPPADLRARIVSQLPGSGSRLPGAGLWLPAGSQRTRWILAAGVAAAILLALVVTRHDTAILPHAPVVATALDTRLPAKRVAAVEPPPAIPLAPPRPVAAAAPRRIAAAAVELDGPSITIEPLNRIAPINVAPIAGSRVTPATIAIAPLSPIAEMQIAPLTPPDRR